MTLSRTCQCVFYRSAFCLVTTLTRPIEQCGEEKMKNKEENNNVEDHILSLFISRKETALLDPWLPFQLTKLINGDGWSSLHTMALARRLKPPFEINDLCILSSEVIM